MRFVGDALSAAALLALVFAPLPFLKRRDRKARAMADAFRDVSRPVS